MREDDAVVLGGPAGRRDDVRVRDPHRLLAHEAEQHAAVVGAEHLGGDDLSGAQVAGPPDRAHAAGADLVEQDVAAGEAGSSYRRARTFLPAPRRFIRCARPLLALGVLCVDHPGRAETKRIALLPRKVRGRPSPQEVDNDMRAYEVMVILDPSIEERTVEGSLDKYLNVIRKDGGSVESVDVWGRRRLAYEVKKNAEGIYAVITLNAEPATVKEFDRQLTLNESILRTKVMRPDAH